MCMDAFTKVGAESQQRIHEMGSQAAVPGKRANLVQILKKKCMHLLDRGPQRQLMRSS